MAGLFTRKNVAFAKINGDFLDFGYASSFITAIAKFAERCQVEATTIPGT